MLHYQSHPIPTIITITTITTITNITTITITIPTISSLIFVCYLVGTLATRRVESQMTFLQGETEY